MKMKLNKYIRSLFLGCVTLPIYTSCSLDEISYSRVTPDTFFTSEESTYAVLSRPFVHWKYYIDQGRETYRCWELTTDEMCCPQRGSDFYNGGDEQRLWYHQWTPEHKYIGKLYDLTLQGVAYALAAREDLAALDYSKIGMTEIQKTQQLAQMDGIIGYYYLMGLDLFGGLPIYTSSSDEIKARSSERELFNHVEKLLSSAKDNLPIKIELNQKQDGYMTKAAAAILLARLYFNAEKYLVDRNTPDKPADLQGVDYFKKSADLCQELIDGKYGPYGIEEEWNTIFGFDNNVSKEAVWSVPCQTTYLEGDYWYRYMMPYNAHVYFNIEKHTAYNGYMLTPSLKPDGTPYDYKLGSTSSKFNDKDLRKKPYYYIGNKQYEGMFLMGELRNPDTGQACVGNKALAGKVINLVDYVALISSNPGVDPSTLESSMKTGDENSGFRLVKWPIPNQDDVDIRWDPDYAYIRFTEVYYMLAECKMRRGDKQEAADLINYVRTRNFPGRLDPDPVTADNLDMYRMLDEWMIEFLGESRRRTDLIRWDQFTEGEWWDHKPSKDKKLNRFPIPTTAITASSGLVVQTPGY